MGRQIALRIARRVVILLTIALFLLVVGFWPQNVLTMISGIGIGMTISMLWDYRVQILKFINGPESEA